MQKRREGGCLCGRIRYDVTGDPLAIVACHCTQCQGQSGSAFGMSMVVPRENFQILEGELRKYAARADSGTAKDCMFCGDCGTRIYNALSSLLATFNLKPGTLDDTSWLRPVAHVWVAHKQPWVPVPGDLPAYEGNPS